MAMLRLLFLAAASVAALQSQQYAWEQKLPKKLPPSRYYHVMADDDSRGRVVVFGGLSPSAGPLLTWLNDTWEWDGSDWTRKTPAQSPPPRQQAAMAYDALRREIVLFGGAEAAGFGDTWGWDGTNWSRKSPAHSPPVRAGHAMAYDAARGEVVMFGGTSTADTWVWDGTDWREKTPVDKPSPRSATAMAYDAVRRRVILFGGRSPAGLPLSDTWAWDGTDWEELSPSGSPPARGYHAMAFDDVTGTIVLFGGVAVFAAFEDTWLWDGKRWTQKQPDVNPPARYGHGLAYDAARGEVVLYGGTGTVSFLSVDTWVWSSDLPLVSLTRDGIANAASYLGGIVAPGEIVTLFGRGFGPRDLASLRLDENGRVATSLAGTRVLFDGIAAPMIYALRDQVSVVVPYGVAGKSVTGVQVEYNDWTTDVVRVPVLPSAPGIFALDASGQGPGAILNEDYSVNSAAKPAKRGSVVMIFATGEGETDPPGQDGVLAGLVLPKPVLPVSVTIGGAPAVVEYAGGAPGLVAGVLQVNARIPEGVTPGAAVPVVVKIGSASSQPGVTMAVE